MADGDKKEVGRLGKAFSKVTTDIKMAQAQNEFLDDTNVDEGRLHNAVSDVVDAVNVTVAGATSTITAPITALTDGKVNVSGLYVRSSSEHLKRKSNRVYDMKDADVKALRKEGYNGESVSSDDLKQALGQTDRGQRHVHTAIDGLTDLYLDDGSSNDPASDADDDLEI